MATGDQADFSARLRALLPAAWFPTTAPGEPSATPVLDGVLAGLGSAWAGTYTQLAYARLQTRIGTATDIFLDLISADFFGPRFPRRGGEGDDSFRARIEKEIFRPRVTRAAMDLALFDLTGHHPRIFEPGNTSDTGGWTVGGIGYGVAGGYGSLLLPFQAFITVTRGSTSGVAGVAGYSGGNGDTVTDGADNAVLAGNNATLLDGSSAYLGVPGGYGVGAIEYASRDMIAGYVTDDEIYQTIHDTQPAGSIMWTALIG